MAKLVCCLGRISYSIDFKQKVFNQLKDSLSLRDSCLKFNIPTDSTIIKWKRFANFGLEGLQPKPKADQNHE
jgi:transposase